MEKLKNNEIKKESTLESTDIHAIHPHKYHTLPFKSGKLSVMLTLTTLKFFKYKGYQESNSRFGVVR